MAFDVDVARGQRAARERNRACMSSVVTAEEVRAFDVPDDPEIRLYQPLLFEDLACLLVAGRTRAVPGAADVTVTVRTSEGELVLTAGVSPRTRKVPGYRSRVLWYFADGNFIGLIPDVRAEVLEVSATTDFTLLNRKLPPRSVRWPESVAEAASAVATDGPQPAYCEALVESSHLQALAVAATLWARAEPRTITVPDTVAVIVGEAFRKSGMAPLAVLFLCADAPRHVQTDEAERYAVRFDILCDALGYGEDVERLLAEELAVNGESGWYYTNLGHVARLQGAASDADLAYGYAARLLQASRTRGAHFNNGVFTWRGDAAARSLSGALRRVAEPAQLSRPPHDREEARIVHLIAADDLYFQKWGAMLLHSTLSAGADHVIVHVHVVNPSASTLEVLQAWEGRDDVCVRFSTERVGPENCTLTFYTCVRFLIAPAVAHHYRLPVMVTDIDMLVNARWGDICDKLSDADVAYIDPSGDATIRGIGGRVRPWALAAGSVYFGTGLGHRYLRFVADYIAALIDWPPEERWYEVWSIDQVALGRGMESVIQPAGGVVRNLRLLRFFKGPTMHAGGKDAFVVSAPGPDELPPYFWREPALRPA